MAFGRIGSGLPQDDEDKERENKQNRDGPESRSLPHRQDDSRIVEWMSWPGNQFAPCLLQPSDQMTLIGPAGKIHRRGLTKPHHQPLQLLTASSPQHQGDQQHHHGCRPDAPEEPVPLVDPPQGEIATGLQTGEPGQSDTTASDQPGQAADGAGPGQGIDNPFPQLSWPQLDHPKQERCE